MFRKSMMCFVLASAMLASGAGIAHDPRQHGEAFDNRALPLRDGNRSTQAKRDHVMSCKTDFSNGRGAIARGDWLNGATWDATRKVAVRGDVWWPNARFEIVTQPFRRLLSGNALPTDHPTGSFPVARDDPAARIDPNPNGIAAKEVEIYLPLEPRVAAQPSCLPMGMIGVMSNGVALFNALDTFGNDALAHEVQDRCGGHPERTGLYHYHGNPSCLGGIREKARLVGYALDGFGIYTGFDRDGRELTNADLDECHSRVGRVVWDGREVEMYHYVLTREYPYTVGCFRGSPVRTAFTGGGAGPPGGGGGPPGARRPPGPALRW